jgi:sec-independent protein translocase protein TatA
MIDTMGLDNPIHVAFLLILLLLVFGAKRLPEMGRSLGSGMRGFKDSLSGEHPQPAAIAPEHAPAASAVATQAVAPVPAPLAAPSLSAVGAPETPAA